MTAANNEEEVKTPNNLTVVENSVYVVWKPEYNLGVPIIDDQHRGIVTIINSLYYGMQHNYLDEMLASIVDMLNSYTHIHFRVEEDIFARTDYPKINYHKELHAQLVSKQFSIGKRSLMDKDPSALMEFLKKWWIHHICEEDRQFREYVRISE
ncbi:MAG: bacteriohemerythrin [Acidobacteriota bacterium]|jgi:hemerythrin|nr:bacteriohemerythrin [Acidobacteriota bacterium]